MSSNPSAPKEAVPAPSNAETSSLNIEAASGNVSGLAHALYSDEQPLVPDHSAGTSDYEEESGQSSTHSLTSEIKEFVYENGRQYHRLSSEQSNYHVPADEAERDRLDLFHHMMLVYLGGKLHLAPLKNPQRILDCGTGTGIWALDMGEMYPSAEVIGWDIAPIQPTWTWPNVRFELDDFERDWTYPKDHFDFIHARTVAAGVKSWSRLFSQFYDHVKPGGYIELSEHEMGFHSDDGTLADDTALHKLTREYTKGLDFIGLSLPDGQELKRGAEEAGFEDVKLRAWKQPLGWWPKDKNLKYLGRIALMCLETGFEAYSLGLLTRFAGYSDVEARKLCTDALAELSSGKVHAYYWHWDVVARKPLKE